MPDQVKRAAIYCRISQDRTGAGLGVDRQEKECRELAQRLGWEVVQIYKGDNDTSAFNRRKPREDWVRLLDDLRQGQYDALLAWHVDRMYRRPRDLDTLIEIIEKRHIFVHTVTSGNLDLSNPQGVAMAKVAAVFAEYESGQKSARQKSKHRQLAEDGKEKGGGTRPFGYESNRKEIRENEAALIRDATRLILDECSPLGAIVNDWNKRDIPTVTGARWTKVVLRRMLVSARISGRREHNRIRDIGTITNSNAEWPAIISHEDSDRLRELLTDPERQTNFTGNTRSYLLSGFLYCGIEGCGDRMKARPQGDHKKSYVCADVGRAHLRMIAEPLELYVQEAVLDYLDEFITSFADAAVQGEDKTSESELWQTLNKLKERQKKLNEDHYVHGKLMDREYADLATQLEVRIEEAKQAIDQVRGRVAISKLPRNSDHARELWETADLEWRRRLVTTLVERVTVGPGRRGLNKFDPNRVSIRWKRPE